MSTPIKPVYFASRKNALDWLDKNQSKFVAWKQEGQDRGEFMEGFFFNGEMEIKKSYVPDHQRKAIRLPSNW